MTVQPEWVAEAVWFSSVTVTSIFVLEMLLKVGGGGAIIGE